VHGVSTPKARALAARLPAEVVRVGISHVEAAARDGERPHACREFSSTVLQDGTADAGGTAASISEREGESVRPGAELDRRTAQVGVLMGALGAYRESAQRDELLRRELVVRSVWPTNEALAAAGVLTDDELAAARERPLGLLATLEAEAGKRRAAEPGPRPAVRRDAGQAALGGRA
jgi:hypothetical protein